MAQCQSRQMTSEHMSARESDAELVGLLEQLVRQALDDHDNCTRPDVESLKVPRLLQLAHSHKVIPLVRSQLTDLIPPALDENLNRLFGRHREWCTKVSDALPEGSLVLKGPSLANAYPNPHVRYFADIDVWTPTLNGLVALEEALLAIGLLRSPLSFIRYADRGRRLAQLSMRFVPPVKAPGFAGVECHALTYPVDESCGIEAQWLLSHAIASRDARNMRWLDATGLACVAFADLAALKREKLRDVIDLYFLARQLDHDQIRRIASFIRELRLEAHAARLIARVKQALPRQFPPALLQLRDQLSSHLKLEDSGERASASCRRRASFSTALMHLGRFATRDAAPRSMRGTTRRILSTRLASELWRRKSLVMVVPDIRGEPSVAARLAAGSDASALRASAVQVERSHDN